MESGTSGFLVKDGPVEGLADAIRKVLAGQQVIDPALAAAALVAGPNPLTDRERDVLAAADGGATIADIAKRLSCPTAPCETICPPSGRPTPATASRPSRARAAMAGCSD